jgi:DNA polymerase III delta prime subunit
MEAPKKDRSAYYKAYQAKHAEIKSANHRAWRIRNAESVRKRKKIYADANKELIRATSQEYHLKNGDARRAKNREYRAKHADRLAARQGVYQASRRAREVRATPKWNIEFFMSEAYALARLRTKMTGFKWHVDHTVPLKNKLVCGLNAHTNIQVIPAFENLSKLNRHWPDMPDRLPGV